MDYEIIQAERSDGIRVSDKRGYEIIYQSYFLYEFVLESRIDSYEKWKNEFKTFNSFDEYYKYLEGDIYDNACYYQCEVPKSEYQVDRKLFYKNNRLINLIE